MEPDENEAVDEDQSANSIKTPKVTRYEQVITYFLWFTFGWFGAHHFYLKRDRHAFVWFWTLGGFGVGWLAEVINLNSYILQSKYEESYINGTLHWTIPNYPRKPPTDIKRVVGEIMFSALIGFFALGIIPSELLDAYPVISVVFTTLGVAAGVHTVANIGYQRCSLKSCLIGSLLPALLFLSTMPLDTTNILFYSSIGSTISANWKGVSWRSKRPKHRNICKRVVVFGFANLAMTGLIIGAIYFTGSITNQYGEKVRVRDSVQNMINSPAWAEFKTTLKLLWDKLREGGFSSFRRAMSIALDPDGEENAYRVLGVPSGAKEEEIRKSYKALVKQYHPDKVVSSSEEEKREVQEKFVEIQQAYERLSEIKARRARKNEL